MLKNLIKDKLTPYVTNELVKKYEERNKYRYKTFEECKCLKCDGKIVFLEYEKEWGNEIYQYICEGSILMYVCIKCEIYYVICWNCIKDNEEEFDDICPIKSNDRPIQLCKIVGFDSYNYDNFYRPNKPKKFITDCINSNKDDFIHPKMNDKNTEYTDNIYDYKDETIDYGFISYWMGDKEQYYLHKNENKTITGPDGGACHYWKCPRCDKIHFAQDK